MVRGRLRARRDQRGAAAVEGAIIAAFILVPLLSGLLYYGNYFWQAQRVATLNVTGVPPGAVAGTYTCSQLTDRVKNLVAGNVSALAAQLGLPVSAITVTTTVVRVLPTIGADVQVAIKVPVANQLASALPLPNNGSLVQAATQRLESVKVTTSSC